jgi:acyl carrier protein
MSVTEQQIKEMVLTVHRRNGGALTDFALELRLMEPSLLIDSLDLAEIMVKLERQFGISPFDLPIPPRTWRDVVAGVANSARAEDQRHPE